VVFEMQERRRVESIHQRGEDLGRQIHPAVEGQDLRLKG